METVFTRIWHKNIIDGYLTQVKHYHEEDFSDIEAFLNSQEAKKRSRQMETGSYLPLPENIYVFKEGNQKRSVYRYNKEDTALMSLINYALRQYRSAFIPTAYSAPGKNGRYGFTESIARTFHQKFFAMIDIRNFYDSISEERLSAKLDRCLFEDPIFCNFIKALIHNHSYYKNGELYHDGPAVKAGCSLSSFMANVYLNEMDKQMASDQRISYFRYIDSIVILADNLNVIEEKKNECYRYLNTEGLIPHEGKTMIGAPGDSFCWGEFILKSEEDHVCIDLNKKFFSERIRCFIRSSPSPSDRDFVKTMLWARAMITMLNKYNRKYFSYHIFKSNGHILKQIQDMELEVLRRSIMGKSARARYSLSYKHILKMGFHPLV